MMFKLIRHLVFIFNLLVLLALMLSYISSEVNPMVFPYLHFFGLGYLFWLIGTIIFCIFWMFSKFKYLIVNVLVLFIGWNTHQKTFGFNTENSNKNGLQIASFNSMGLGQEVQGNYEDIIAYVEKEKIDILAILEYKSKNDRTPPSWYSQFIPTKKDGVLRPGIQLLSKYPIEKASKIHFDKTIGNMAVRFDVNVQGKTIAIFALHLETNQINHKDYQKIKSPSLHSSYLSSTKKILQKLSRQVKTRSEQSKAVIEEIKKVEGPFLVLGDFNDVPTSFVYQQFTPYTSDAFLKRGTGFGPTYLKPFPTFRIDYILYSKEFECNRYFSTKEIYSDHKLVGANLQLHGLH